MGIIQNALNQTIGKLAIAAKLARGADEVGLTKKSTTKTISADEDIIRAEQAMLKVAKKQDTQLKQKRRFKDYIKDLSPEFQEMARNLPPSMKKEYMDFKDKEKMNKDGK